MKTYVLKEMGYFTKKEADKIVELANCKTFMRFKVGYSNECGNCIISISTDYDDVGEEIKNFFSWYLIRTLINKEAH